MQNLLTNTTIQLNTWYFFAATLDYTNGILTLYIDGKVVAQDTSFGGSTDATSAAVNIGRRRYSGGLLYTQGKIDDVRIYDRALSSDEVKRLYDLGR